MKRPRIKPLHTWTLSAKLVAAMIGLRTVVCAVVGVLTMLSLNQQLMRQVDDDLGRTVGPAFLQIRDGRTPATVAAGPWPPDTLAAYVVDGKVVVAGVFMYGEGSTPLTSSQQQALAALDIPAQTAGGPGGPGPGGEYVSRSIGDLGNFRFTQVDTTDGGRLIVGKSLKRVDNTISRLTISVTMIGLAGLIAAGLVGSWIVRHSLQPLRRVARTAGRPLDRGEVALAERVPVPDTDPNTEVGQVGNALNRMLDHIDSALAARQASETRVRQFVADASHELRTPLAAIRGYSEVTRRG